MDIPALEATVRSLEHSMGIFTWCLLGSTFFVALGLVLEYWHPVSEFIDELKWPMSTFRWPKFMEIVGGILVTVGVLGEFGFTLEVFVLEGRLEKANHDIRDALTEKLGEADTKAKEAVADSSTALGQAKDALSKAGSAEASLGKAEDEAKNAQAASSDALATAKDAHKEADAFESEIKAAKKQAEDIAKELTPRTLSPKDTKAIGDKLKPFSFGFVGRKVTISSYSQDAEGIAFSVEIFHCFDNTGIETDPVIGRLMPIGLVDIGVKITGPIKDEAVIRLLAHEIHDRADTEVTAEWGDKYKELAILVAVKPVAGLPKIIPSNAANH